MKSCLTQRTLGALLIGAGITGAMSTPASANDASRITPDLLNTIDIGGEITDSVAMDSVLYTNSRPGRLHLYDVTDPSFPVLLGSYHSPGNSWSVTAVEGRAYIAYDIAGLAIPDVSDPTNPTLMSRMTIGRSAYDIKEVDDVAYIAAEEGGLKIIDVSNPFEMEIIANNPTFGTAGPIAVINSTVYLEHHVGNSDSSLKIINVSDPTSPAALGSFNTFRRMLEFCGWRTGIHRKRISRLIRS